MCSKVENRGIRAQGKGSSGQLAPRPFFPPAPPSPRDRGLGAGAAAHAGAVEAFRQDVGKWGIFEPTF